MSDRLSTLLGRLNGVRDRRNGSWVACCPAHKNGNERTPSLSIRYAPPGQILIKCFAGCDVYEILAAVGLEMADLFPEKVGASPYGAPGMARPAFPLRDLLAAFTRELHIVWVLLSDVAGGREIGPAERARAGKARERCQALIQELQNYGR